jgi:hypothetical protein
MFPWNRISLEGRYFRELGVKCNWSKNSTDREGRIVFGPEDPDRLRAVYEGNIEGFQGTRLYQRFTNLVTPLFERRKINKIVAFGAMGLAVGDQDQLTWRMHAQHAALEAMRDIWKKGNPSGGQFEIYLQDPQYQKIDSVVAEQHNMTIVNCRPGHQLGWLQIDEFTLVVDWAACFPVIELALEIARPAALFTTGTIASSRENDYWGCTVKHEDREIQCPGLGR